LVAVTSGPTSIYVTGTINAEEDLSGKRLFVTAIHNEVTYQTPPGANGETIFDCPFRDVYPNANSGEVITASPGIPYNFECTVNMDASWDAEEMSVIAWVQTMTSKEIHQATWVPVSQDYAMTTETESPRQRIIAPSGGEATYEVTVNNNGNLDDIYTVELTGEFPEGWTHTISAPGVDPNPDQIQVGISTLESTMISIAVNPNGTAGEASFELHVTSQGLPALSLSEDFRLMSGLEILLVDDDAGSDFETYYETSLDAMEASFITGRWDLSLDELDPSNLTGLDAIIWFTGNTFQDGTTLTAIDQLYLSDYLTAGGNLLLTGQGIGFDIRTDQFMSEYLHAFYERNYPQGQHVTGITGDPVADGLAFPISGGDGASNQTRQSALSPVDEFAHVMFHYDDSEWDGALRIETETYRVIYLGFGFEAIDNPDSRNTLMQNSIEWLTDGTSDADEPGVTIPAEFALGQNYPNPFNPETVIPYALPVRADVTIRVFDVLGREAVELFHGSQNAGTHTITWNAANQSSGVYFYTLEANSGDNIFRSTRKLVLMK
jgi:hypothetical protein